MSEPEKLTLHYLRRRECCLQSALVDFRRVAALDQESAAVGFFSTPRAFRIVRIGPERVTNSQGLDVALDDIFEVRAFTEYFELRWLNVSGGTGTAVILSEIPAMKIDDWKSDSALVEVLRPNVDLYPSRYLIWGRVHNTSATTHTNTADWTVMTEGRIGEISIPLAGGRNEQQAALRYREYLDSDGDGNVFVMDERFILLEFVQ